MRLIGLRAWLLVLLSALLQVLCFPTAGPLPLWRAALSWVALAPFLLALLDRKHDQSPLTLRQSAILGYACGIGWYLGNCSWIYQTMYLYGGLAKPVAFAILILFSMYLGLYHALFAALVTLAKSTPLGSLGALFLCPFAWVAVELARARITGFPWDMLGYTQVDNLLLTSLAPIAGVMALSFAIAAVNALLTAAFCLRGRPRLFVAVTAAALIFTVALSPFRPRPEASTSQPSETVVMMQENLSVGKGADGERAVPPTQEVALFSASSLHPQSLVLPSTPHPTVIVWPEAPSHLQTEDPAFRSGLTLLAQAAKAPVIAGSVGVDFDRSSPRGYFLYDSAAFFTQTGTYAGRYDKIHLVPWGEYIPFKQFFSFAEKLTEGVGDMDRGRTRNTFQTAGHTYGVFVCYESIFGDEVRQFAKAGADVLVNISDDGWYGDTGAPWQHLNMARMRAIENNRWVLRSTNTGITTTIDPHGRYTDTPRHVRTAYALPFAFTTGQTFYTRYGDWFAYLCAAVTAFALAASLLRR